MRIVGGKHRSRILKSPKNKTIRPTSNKVRLAVFNMLKARQLVDKAIVIDAFCGTGALGLEALSQGASYCYFFDKNKQSLSLCQENIRTLEEEENTSIQLCDVIKIKQKLQDARAATLVFLDPPYHQGLVDQTINALHKNNWLSRECIFVIEVAKDETLTCDYVDITQEKIYGDTKIILADYVS